jgi:hypothetical protein
MSKSNTMLTAKEAIEFADKITFASNGELGVLNYAAEKAVAHSLSMDADTTKKIDDMLGPLLEKRGMSSKSWDEFKSRVFAAMRHGERWTRIAGIVNGQPSPVRKVQPSRMIAQLCNAETRKTDPIVVKTMKDVESFDRSREAADTLAKAKAKTFDGVAARFKTFHTAAKETLGVKESAELDRIAELYLKTLAPGVATVAANPTPPAQTVVAASAAPLDLNAFLSHIDPAALVAMLQKAATK